MRRKEPQLCANCGTPTAGLLCDRCAEVCDILSPAGRYHTHRKALRSGHGRHPDPKEATHPIDRRPTASR